MMVVLNEDEFEDPGPCAFCGLHYQLHRGEPIHFAFPIYDDDPLEFKPMVDYPWLPSYNHIIMTCYEYVYDMSRT